MGQENIIYSRKPRSNNWIYIIGLILSFVWLEFYPSTLSFMYTFEYGFGDMFSSVNLLAVIESVIFEGLISWVSFEIVFWIYRWVLSFKIYSFIVPLDSLKAESRLYFIIRNVFLGLVYNLCFIMPYLYSFSMFFDILITMIVMICYAKHLNLIYGESIIGHFVFKNFCYPIIFYEAIEILCCLWVVL